MRRCKELAERGMPADYEVILADMNARDEADRTRAIAPAVAAPDAYVFDNSNYDFDASVAELLRIIQTTAKEKGLSLA